MNDHIIADIEIEWEKPSGFLGGLRLGIYTQDGFERLLSLLNSINLEGQSQIDRRLVSLIWYIPIFMSWQRERVNEQGGNVSDFDTAINLIQECLERILGIP